MKSRLSSRVLQAYHEAVRNALATSSTRALKNTTLTTLEPSPLTPFNSRQLFILKLCPELSSHDGIPWSIDEMGFLADSFWHFLASKPCCIASTSSIISELAASFGSFSIAASIIISERPRTLDL